MFALTWITEKEQERVTEDKRDEFRGKKKMKTPQQGVASEVKMSGSEK